MTPEKRYLTDHTPCGAPRRRAVLCFNVQPFPLESTRAGSLQNRYRPLCWLDHIILKLGYSTF
ncbi:hypothetical protein J6590_083542 [Homalodisca vitripennis]|nr:hypothetical protein J6590_083542 [Homalodisca vitripennis]